MVFLCNFLFILWYILSSNVSYSAFLQEGLTTHFVAKISRRAWVWPLLQIWFRVLLANRDMDLLWKMNFCVIIPTLTGVEVMQRNAQVTDFADPQLVSVEMKSDGLDCFSNRYSTCLTFLLMNTRCHYMREGSIVSSKLQPSVLKFRSTPMNDKLFIGSFIRIVALRGILHLALSFPSFPIGQDSSDVDGECAGGGVDGFLDGELRRL